MSIDPNGMRDWTWDGDDVTADALDVVDDIFYLETGFGRLFDGSYVHERDGESLREWLGDVNDPIPAV